jgi:hypothetical protein
MSIEGTSKIAAAKSWGAAVTARPTKIPPALPPWIAVVLGVD